MHLVTVGAEPASARPGEPGPSSNDEQVLRHPSHILSTPTERILFCIQTNAPIDLGQRPGRPAHRFLMYESLNYICRLRASPASCARRGPGGGARTPAHSRE